MSEKIGDTLCFRTRFRSLIKAKEALKIYEANINNMDDWLYEDSEMPIFMDTCVLLNLYDISELERNAFINFIQKNKGRIYIPSQVEREYNRHRIPQINGFKSRVNKLKDEVLTVLETLAKNYQNIKGGLVGLSNRNIIKYGMPQVSSKLKELTDHLSQPQHTSELQEKFRQTIDFVRQHLEEECGRCCDNANFEYADPILEALASTTIMTSLTDEEQKYIVDIYKQLREIYDNKKTGDGKLGVTFPGAGDSEKPVDGSIDESVAWGDLYIYHEMLRFMKDMDSDVVFLTRDVSKSDWVKADHTPFVHYLVNGYEMTGHLMYILDADGLIPMTFQSIADQPEEDKDEIGEPLIAKSTSVESGGREDSVEDNKETDDVFDKAFTEWLDSIMIEKDGQVKDVNCYNPITVDEFMAELRKTTKWASTYGAGYVGENYFIYNILRNKHYDFSSIKEALSELIEAGTVERRNEEHDGHSFSCLVIITKE